MPSTLTEEEALGKILAAITPLPSRLVSLGSAWHFFAAKPLLAMVPVPAFNNAAMDGYALRAADSAKPEPLRVSGEQPAGRRRDLKVGPGEAVRIFTGAPLPEGADAVIMQEDVDRLDDGARITCKEPVKTHENIRAVGCDVCVGQRVVDTGDHLNSVRLGLLATQGLNSFEVSDAPRVAIVTTGDELAAPNAPLHPGEIHNSNVIMLQGLLAELGVHETETRHAPDDYVRTAEILRELVESHDFIIICGGVSVGDRDCVRPALQALRLRPIFWRVKIKPGKPLLFTQSPRGDEPPCTIFGLPGNPVSAFVTFQLFVRPALLKAMGAAERYLKLPQARAVLAAPLNNPSRRPHYVRGRHDAGKFTPVGGQRSHEMLSLGNSNALLRMDPTSTLAAGTGVEVLLLPG